MRTEYVRNLHSNYVRLALEEKPEEKRYQYCILSRGGIKGLLPASLRYLDGDAYLYYDITSRQSLVQLHQKGGISREWFLDFLASLQRLGRELERFLLQEDNVIWDPQHVFQDLENNVFSFLYVPYYQGENQFLRLLSFLVEKIDYEDQELVECVYKMYEQVEKNGVAYLQGPIFKDAEVLEGKGAQKGRKKEAQAETDRDMDDLAVSREMPYRATTDRRGAMLDAKTDKRGLAAEGREDRRGLAADGREDRRGLTADGREDRRGLAFDMAEESESRGLGEQEGLMPKKIFGLFDNKRARKQKEPERREEYREITGAPLSNYLVAESSDYDEEYGKTAYIMQRPDKKEGVHRLFYLDGRKASDLSVPNLLIGKYKDKVDLYLADDSVSRMHARILKEQEDYYLEDANSTNGTFQNKKRLEPYERKRLEPGDELRFGNVSLVFR
ncbi:MAG: FHA domain-containing protein [Lachnospiraceae bacterium]|nr:FHA domain-containing protein [Lachnospiraceae bacterium]